MNELATILGNFVFKQLTNELIRQGHKLTGALIDSFETMVVEKSDVLIIQFMMLKYGHSLNKGIKPNKIPYTIGGAPRGGTSKYIQGLIRFAKLKFFVDEKKAKGIAFAIAYKHKKEGYTIDKSKLGFIDNVLESEMPLIEKLISDFFEETLNLMIEEYLTFKTAA